jgi:hypothetical protein
MVAILQQSLHYYLWKYYHIITKTSAELTVAPFPGTEETKAQKWQLIPS